jgi:hypothetical protein
VVPCAYEKSQIQIKQMGGFSSFSPNLHHYSLFIKPSETFQSPWVHDQPARSVVCADIVALLRNDRKQSVNENI